MSASERGMVIDRILRFADIQQEKRSVEGRYRLGSPSPSRAIVVDDKFVIILRSSGFSATEVLDIARIAQK